MAVSAAVVGCTTVNFQQLNADLSAKRGSPAGAVYYLPKPYLLVAELPAAADVPASTGSQPNTAPGSKRGKPAADASASGWPTYAPGGAPAAGKGGEEAPTATGSSDLSFTASTDEYVMKLVYLPDLSRPMSMSVRAGFGSASLKPTLQNGWMLTGFDASADSKTAEVLASVAQVLTAYKTPGKAGGGNAEGGGGTAATRDNRRVLRPGLYEFRYNETGQMFGLCPVSFFAETGVLPAGACL